MKRHNATHNNSQLVTGQTQAEPPGFLLLFFELAEPQGVSLWCLRSTGSCPAATREGCTVQQGHRCKQKSTYVVSQLEWEIFLQITVAQNKNRRETPQRTVALVLRDHTQTEPYRASKTSFIRAPAVPKCKVTPPYSSRCPTSYSSTSSGVSSGTAWLEAAQRLSSNRLPTHNKEGKTRCSDGGSGGDNLPHKAKQLAKRLKGKCFHQGSVHR